MPWLIGPDARCLPAVDDEDAQGVGLGRAIDLDRLTVGKRYVSVRALNEKNWVAINVEPRHPGEQREAAPKGKRK